MRILVVEDQLEIAANLKHKLEGECYAVDVEHDGNQGFYRARTNDYDLILLDNVLPGKGGYEICSELKVEPLPTIDDTGTVSSCFPSGISVSISL